MAGESLTAPVGLREAGQVHQAAQPHSPGGARLVLVPWSPPPPPPPSLWKDSRLTGGHPQPRTHTSYMEPCEDTGSQSLEVGGQPAFLGRSGPKPQGRW